MCSKAVQAWWKCVQDSKDRCAWILSSQQQWKKHMHAISACFPKAQWFSFGHIWRISQGISAPGGQCGGFDGVQHGIVPGRAVSYAMKGWGTQPHLTQIPHVLWNHSSDGGEGGWEAANSCMFWYIFFLISSGFYVSCLFNLYLYIM